uniref:Dipeptidylpeptidase IV N-terminal domain-containing protein n=1 Tax=Timema monikensis TaxID=170555 RepID=A0A7R9E4G1_9NEOP|nr:unnamed protein product [Timema monikensis]
MSQNCLIHCRLNVAGAGLENVSNHTSAHRILVRDLRQYQEVRVATSSNVLLFVLDQIAEDGKIGIRSMSGALRIVREVQRARCLGSCGAEISLISGRSVESHHALSYEMGDIDRRSILEVYTHLHGGRVETSFGKLSSVHPDRDSNLSFTVIDSLVYCKNSTLDYAGTEVELRCIIVLLALAYAAVETEARTVVDQPRVIGQPFSLEEIIGGVFSQRGFRGTWEFSRLLQARSYKFAKFQVPSSAGSTEFLYADSVTGDILRYDVTTGTNATLVLKEVLTAYNAGGYTLSPDGLYLLLSYDTQSGFRHSTTSKFVIYDIENSVYSNVSGTSYLQIARWSPRGSALVFVLDNNIFYRPDASNETQHQITRTGEPGVYYNGVPDWVYEEEVFGSGSAFWISPRGDSLAFAVFNDTEVDEFSYFLYGTPGDLEDQYVTLRTIKYPKNSPTVLKTRDGDHVEKGISLDLSGVSVLFYYQLQCSEHSTASLSCYTSLLMMEISGFESLSGLLRSGTKNPHVSLKVVDLTQDLTYDPITVVDLPAPTDIEHQWGEPEGWLTPGTPLFDDAGTRFVTILSESQGEVDGDFNHVILIDTSSGERRALTSGRYTVTSIYGWNTEAAIIYYLGTGVDAPTNRHVYSVTEGGVNTCLSCPITTPEGNKCLYSTATFSQDLSHYSITCSGPDPATVTIFKVTDVCTRTW